MERNQKKSKKNQISPKVRFKRWQEEVELGVVGTDTAKFILIAPEHIKYNEVKWVTKAIDKWGIRIRTYEDGAWKIIGKYDVAQTKSRWTPSGKVEFKSLLGIEFKKP